MTIVGTRQRILVIDFILTSPGAMFSDFSRPLSEASDHLPVAITVSF